MLSTMITAFKHYAQVVLVRLNSKVDKVDNKQLSTEDYTTEEKVKLSNVKSMAMRDLHVSQDQPDNAIGSDGDIWLVISQPE